MFLLLLAFFLIFPAQVRADTTLSFVMHGDHFDKENSLVVEATSGNMESKLTHLKIRPLMDPEQMMFIYADGKIFSLGNFWTEAPSLPTKLILRAPIPFQTAELWFEVLDTKTNRMYETPKKLVFGHTFAKAQIFAINDQLFGRVLK